MIVNEKTTPAKPAITDPVQPMQGPGMIPGTTPGHTWPDGSTHNSPATDAPAATDLGDEPKLPVEEQPKKPVPVPAPTPSQAPPKK